MTLKPYFQKMTSEQFKFCLLDIGLLFDIESRNAYVKVVTSQKRLKTSFKLYMDKLLIFRKDFGKSQNRETFLLSNCKFSGVI